MTEPYKYVFGPVRSRRLGLSLGVDLVPAKVCPFDCIYCQVGRTTRLTLQRDVYVPTEELLAEVAEALAENRAIDYVTLSGAGEPTLHRDLGRIVAAIRGMARVPLAVITDGMLLHDPRVRADLAGADLVMPSLDAGDPETFERVNRPVAGATFDRLVEGLVAFRREYRGRYALEVLLVEGVNDSPAQLAKIRALIDRIGPDCVDVNTVTRPAAEAGARGLSPERLIEAAALLGPKARVIAAGPVKSGGAGMVQPPDVLAVLGRHPSTLEDLAEALHADRAGLGEVLRELLRDGKVTLGRMGPHDYYQLSGPSPTGPREEPA